ncbi:T9SS type A sorting domain-containing protein [Chryseobacterium gossypii]|uniref:T9SS type A sorting domain-containing protein n=1 Tax=Chryseobacterium gossypii TaxID=3231602 RepID=UPI003524B685
MKVKLLLGALVFSTVTANAQLASINENFETFTTGTTSLPQNGWGKVTTGPMVYIDGTTNKYLQGYSFFFPNTAYYAVSPQIVAPNGSQTLTFTAAQTTGSAGAGTIEVGLVASPSDMSTFTSLGAPVTLSSTTEQTITLNVPSSAYQYLAFKFVSTVAHGAFHIDNVVLTAATTLGVSDQIKSADNIRFAVNSENSALEFVAKKEPKNIDIYSTAGQKVAEGKLQDRKFDISSLQTGVYYIIIETAEGAAVRSKFIKR